MKIHSLQMRRASGSGTGRLPGHPCGHLSSHLVPPPSSCCHRQHSEDMGGRRGLGGCGSGLSPSGVPFCTSPGARPSPARCGGLLRQVGPRGAPGGEQAPAGGEPSGGRMRADSGGWVGRGRGCGEGARLRGSEEARALLSAQGQGTLQHQHGRSAPLPRDILGSAWQESTSIHPTAGAGALVGARDSGVVGCVCSRLSPWHAGHRRGTVLRWEDGGSGLSWCLLPGHRCHHMG